MIKLVSTLKKKKGMSTDSFRAYYESHHRLIGEKYLGDYAARYVRRYLTSVPDAEGNLDEPVYDVLLEIWFPDESAFLGCTRKLREPEIAREIEIDEEKLFDTSQKRTYLVEECGSEMGDQLSQ